MTERRDFYFLRLSYKRSLREGKARRKIWKFYMTKKLHQQMKPHFLVPIRYKKFGIVFSIISFKSVLVSAFIKRKHRKVWASFTWISLVQKCNFMTSSLRENVTIWNVLRKVFAWKFFLIIARLKKKRNVTMMTTKKTCIG